MYATHKFAPEMLFFLLTPVKKFFCPSIAYHDSFNVQIKIVVLLVYITKVKVTKKFVTKLCQSCVINSSARR